MRLLTQKVQRFFLKRFKIRVVSSGVAYLAVDRIGSDRDFCDKAGVKESPRAEPVECFARAAPESSRLAVHAEQSKS